MGAAGYVRVFACALGMLGCAKGGIAASDAPGNAPGSDAPVAPDAPPDAVPGTVSVTIMPAMPRTTDDLTAAIVDLNNPVAYTIRWTRSGVVQPMLTAATVGNALTTKGDVWAIDLVDAQAHSLANASVTIANSPPVAPTAGLGASPMPGQPIQCLLVGGATDADADPITYHAEWTRNGLAFTGVTSTAITGDTIPAGVSVNGDTFSCTIFASDGTDTTPSLPVSTQPSCAGHVPPPASYGFTSSTQFYQVPICAAHLTIEVWGAQGAGPNGGRGGYARGTVAVTTGQILYVEVGGTNSYNGGGPGIASTNPANGGGATDVRVNDDQLTSRIIVAGGGGGGPTVDLAWVGGAGGAGGCGANYCGGAGGSGYGGSPGTTAYGFPGSATGGQAFVTPHGGGAGGGGLQSGGGGSCQSAVPPMTCGGTGGFGSGGAGAPGGNPLCYSGYGGTAGGGGGYYGGGGTAVGFCGGGAGGGGSSWTGALASPAMSGGIQAGNGTVIITPS